MWANTGELVRTSNGLQLLCSALWVGTEMSKRESLLHKTVINSLVG